MRELKLKDYFNLLKIIFKESILKYKYLKISSIITVFLVIGSTYYSTELAETSSSLLNSRTSADFEKYLYLFIIYSLLTLSLRQIPLCFFTYLIQFVARSKFVESLRGYMNLPYYKFHKRTPGEIRFTVFLKSLSYPMCAQIIIFDFTAFIGVTVFTSIKTLEKISGWIALILLLFPFFYMWYIIEYLKQRLVYRTKNLVELEKTSAKIYDKLSNFDVIKTFNLENAEIESLGESIKGQIETQMATDIFSAKGKFLGRFIMIFPYLLIVFLSFTVPKIMDREHLFEATVMYISVSLQVKKLGVQFYRLSTYLNQIGYDICDEDVSSLNSNNILETGSLSFNDKIEFINVNLYHENNLIVKNINCVIRKNEKIAIVGKNGTGKSTFIKAILGFTSYTGDICIDGINIKDLSNKSLFSMISYISQDDYTSDDTILNNLRLGNREASFDCIVQKTKQFECHDMIMGFENGYDTQAGIRGNRLSGGQRQTLSIARAAIKDASIFILDEATSAIDKNYEMRIMEIFFNCMNKKTIVMIIHENEYLKYFDKIFFLNNNQLEDAGTYDELVERNENFCQFINK